MPTNPVQPDPELIGQLMSGDPLATPFSRGLEVMLDEIERASLAGTSPHGGHGSPAPQGPLPLREIFDGGLQPGSLTLVGSDIPEAQTIFARSMARHAALDRDIPTLVSAPGSDPTRLAMELTAATTTIPLKTLHSGNLDETQWSRLASRIGALSSAPLHCSTNSWISQTQLATVLRSTPALGLLVIDQQVRGSGSDRGHETIFDPGFLKELATKYGVAVVMTDWLAGPARCSPDGLVSYHFRDGSRPPILADRILVLTDSPDLISDPENQSIARLFLKTRRQAGDAWCDVQISPTFYSILEV